MSQRFVEVKGSLPPSLGSVAILSDMRVQNVHVPFYVGAFFVRAVEVVRTDFRFCGLAPGRSRALRAAVVEKFLQR